MKNNIGLYKRIYNSQIKLNLRSKTRDSVLKELVAQLHIPPQAKEILLKTLIKREEMGSTGVGKGIAIPHARTLLVKECTLIIGISKSGVEFNAIDGKPVHLFFLLIAPPQEMSSSYLITLGKIAELARIIAKDGRLFDVKKDSQFREIMKELEGKKK